MRIHWLSTVRFASILIPAALFAAPKMIVPADLVVGRNLQTFGSVKLSEAAPADGLEVTIKSGNPAKLLFAAGPDKPGAASLTLRINGRYIETPDFSLHGLADSGDVTFTATAAGFETVTGSVKLAPSAIAILGPFKQPAFRTTPRMSAKITLRTVIVDAEGKVVAAQPVAGGMTLQADLVTADSKVGSFSESKATIPGGESSVFTEFQPSGVGSTVLSVRVPAGFGIASDYKSVSVTVDQPGMGLSGEINLGKNLQVGGMVLLGEAAPAGGIDVTVTSQDPSKMLLSKDTEKVGSASIVIHIPAGESRSVYHMQGLADSGTVIHTATAQGYRTREAPVTLAPSGIMVVYSHYGPPDRAEVQRAILTRDPRPFTTSLASKKPEHLALYLVYLDPNTRRGADITAQRLRPGITATVDLKNTNPAVANVQTRVVLKDSIEYQLVEFKPLTPGQTEISVTAPDGFMQPSNATSVAAIVNE